jgi:virginiamycin A acetyltransferase
MSSFPPVSIGFNDVSPRKTSGVTWKRRLQIECNLRSFLKNCLRAVFLAVAFPMALLSGFGRLKPLFALFAHSCALAPGLPGDYLRIAYYRLTLDECSLESRIQFGSFFAHPEARVARGVYIGSYCVLGITEIGERSQIASGVQILSGRKQHPRDVENRMMSSEHGAFETVRIGADCWIGAGSIVMANIGSGTTIGAGSVVVGSIPAGSVAVGNPARVLDDSKRRPA